MKYLKIDTQRNYIEAQGSIVDISVLVLEAIGAIYDNYKANGHSKEAEFFKEAIIAGVTFPDSPVFKDCGLNGGSILFNVSEIERMRNHGK